MAQLLVFMRDNTSANPEYDIREAKLGDVIAVGEDSHQWGGAEQSFPFRSVTVAGPMADYTYLLDSEPSTIRDKYPRSMVAIKRLNARLAREVHNDGIHRRFRRWSVDLSDVITRKTMEGV